MNIALLSSTSPLGMRTAQTADLTKGVTRRVTQGFPFPTRGSVTVSNLGGATSHSLSNYTTFSFLTGTLMAPTYNRTNFGFFAGDPVVCGSVYPQYNAIGSLTPTSQSGFGLLGIECVIDADAFELGIYSRGNVTTVEIDGTVVYSSSGAQSRTAQAGAAGSITLYSGESSTNNTHNGTYIYILSGTGAGQRKRITAYNGTTKVATVDSNWSVTPDNTSVYVIGRSPVTCDSTYNSGSLYYPTFTFGGERTSHLVRIYSSNPLLGVYTNSNGSVTRPATSQKPLMFVIGDSFGEGTGAADASSSYGQILASYLGFEFRSSCVGSTGVTNSASGAKTTFKERTCPAVNSWVVRLGGATGGTYTLSQNGTTTSAISYSANVATVQTALDTAFGASTWRAVQINYVNINAYLLIGLNANASVSATLTVDTSSLTGIVAQSGATQYKGDIEPYVPTDGFGNPLPFYILVQGSINDTGNYATLQSAASDLYSSLAARFPTAIILATGTAMSYGTVAGNFLLAETALENASTVLQNVNGRSPFLALFDKTTGIGYMTSGGENSSGASTYHIGNVKGTAGYNVDQYTSVDGVHPSAFGHVYFADVLARGFGDILRL